MLLAAFSGHGYLVTAIRVLLTYTDIYSYEMMPASARLCARGRRASPVRDAVTQSRSVKSTQPTPVLRAGHAPRCWSRATAPLVGAHPPAAPRIRSSAPLIPPLCIGSPLAVFLRVARTLLTDSPLFGSAFPGRSPLRRSLKTALSLGLLLAPTACDGQISSPTDLAASGADSGIGGDPAAPSEDASSNELADAGGGAAGPDASVDSSLQVACVARINAFRATEGKPPLERWIDAESCSDEQSGNDANGGGAHGNFRACGENAQNTCPNWGSTDTVIQGCLQQMWDEGPGEPFSEHGHYINMSSTQYTKVACGFHTGPSGVWANQNFK